MPYVIDTSSLMALRDYYPKRFPTFWSRFDQRVQDGTIISVQEVYRELQGRNVPQWLLDWAQANRGIFLKPYELEMQFVQQIFQVPHFQNLISQKQRYSAVPVADPFLIASAHVKEGYVVTQEAKPPNGAKIPNVCNYFSVGCIDLEGFLDHMNWTF